MLMPNNKILLLRTKRKSLLFGTQESVLGQKGKEKSICACDDGSGGRDEEDFVRLTALQGPIFQRFFSHFYKSTLRMAQSHRKETTTFFVKIT